ncbi:cadherin-like domain-containing protein [Tropicimonas sp.]|uniref:cadherin-like domain-containing protein n=1 Tax=Tropicimonas sp. TaxID=2067044 RepID=UPI003A837D4B
MSSNSALTGAMASVGAFAPDSTMNGGPIPMAAATSREISDHGTGKSASSQPLVLDESLLVLAGEAAGEESAEGSDALNAPSPQQAALILSESATFAVEIADGVSADDTVVAAEPGVYAGFSGSLQTTTVTTTDTMAAMDTLSTDASDAAMEMTASMSGTEMGDTGGMGDMDMGMGMGHHMALLNLVPLSAATHVAVSDGSWFDPATWADGRIPGDDARVVISEGVTVTYDGVSDARLFTVRVDGTLRFATDTDSRMVVDTMVTNSGSHLIIGTQDDPVREGVQIDIVIANNGAIDTSWDTSLLSRGIVALGEVEMHGLEKTTHLKVATDPMAGDTSIELSEIPQNWQVGDTLVLAGTHYDGYMWDNSVRAVRHHEPEDEILTITRIDGNTVYFDTPLKYDHDAPRDDLKTSVANYSRNITIATEDPATAEVYERGHVMFMHNDDVDVRYVEFHELGRTDKSRDAMEAEDYDTISYDTNVKGRYSVHIHRAGVDDDGDDPAMLVGNAVFGSPGWGYVHHDSYAVLHDNASYNTFGAGFVAETGNEIGRWSDNIAIYAQGISWDSVKVANHAGDPAFDLGKTGDGYWLQGRMIELEGNIAASVNNGFVWFHRTPKEGGNIPFDSAVFDFPEALGLSDSVDVDDAPILTFINNETFAANQGLHIVKAEPNQGHDIHTHLRDFTAWSVKNGAQIEYTSHYILENFDLVGREDAPFTGAARGIILGVNTSDITIIDATIDGFRVGIDMDREFIGTTPENPHYAVINPSISGAQTDFLESDPAQDLIVTGSARVVPGRFEILLDEPLTYKEGWPDPDARKVVISGTKIDSLGAISLPSGTDSYEADRAHVIRILETDGFYTASDGNRYFVLESYYSDRLTGEIHKFGHLVKIDPNVPLQSPYGSYKNAVHAGTIDLDSLAPVARGETASTETDTAVVIDLLANDHDPDGDTIVVDGIVQPLHGKVVDNGDGTVTYRPDLEFSGTDSFKYWVTDKFGNFTSAVAQVSVKDSGDTGNGGGNGNGGTDPGQGSGDYLDPLTVTLLPEYNLSAGYDNVLGCYEVDAEGRIVDAQILFESVRITTGLQTEIQNVEKGHSLGFFIVQDAANWARSLGDSDIVSFVNRLGEAASIDDGNTIRLAVNDEAIDKIVFHSLDFSLNPDNRAHARTFATSDDTQTIIGFEDMLGGGDRDYNDVMFLLEAFGTDTLNFM